VRAEGRGTHAEPHAVCKALLHLLHLLGHILGHLVPRVALDCSAPHLGLEKLREAVEGSSGKVKASMWERDTHSNSEVPDHVEEMLNECIRLVIVRLEVIAVVLGGHYRSLG
jgi:hypothetical protein